MSYLEELRQANPLMICITNHVVKNFTANGLLAIGASPAMSESARDLEDLLRYAQGLLINIGSLTEDSWKLYKEALNLAANYGVPAVLDPVAASAGAFRKEVALDLIRHHKLSLVRGNASEIAALIGQEVKSKGVDSASVDDVGQLALAANKALQLPIVVTGVQDAIAVDGQVRVLKNGSALMPLVTGTGCLLGAVLAAFIHLADQDHLLDCLEEALSTYTIAGEMAEQVSSLPGSYQMAFLDALYQITDKEVNQKIRRVNHNHSCNYYK
ncbi:hydroxyethylthiazole kinase [Streptococcus saliviloxodontae]|uniref:Hydroxyethylthiazole kinase n=1 Tax=Streptococcus saliviloxodontae TaxID=1349416 RepID=A0ABS2PM42_9STRE|nr:hydroxyethylthiazole kinase [Streptococcus saliviloxodontae]MBM7636503.1 hydroxyethylthiazole kinase [Streptococcus saliviloxodontae]